MNRTVKDTWLRVIGISLLSTVSILSDEASQQPLTGQGLVLLGLSVARIALSWHLNRALILTATTGFFRERQPLNGWASRCWPVS